MFCKNCGCKIDENSKFCNNCGAKTDSAKEKHLEKNEIERNAVIVHLENMRALEIAKYKLDEKIKDIEKKIHSLGIVHYIPEPEKPKIYTYIILSVVLSFLSLIVIMMLSELIDPNRKMYLVSLLLVLVAIGFSIFFSIKLGGKEYKKKQKETKELIRQNEQRIYSENTQKINLSNKLNDLRKEKNKLESVLTEAYSANIIPMPLRSVYGVSYLYDFMSTSNEPMQAAILSYNLEEVKGRLNNIIAGQSEIIMQQYIQSDHLIALQKQNKHMMAQLDSIDQNTREATYYAKMTASNTSAIAYFKTVEWLKN